MSETNINVSIKTDISAFLRDWTQLTHKQLPEAIVEGFSKTAKRGRDAIRNRTKEVFNLNSDYITNGIKYLPETSGQKSAAVRSLKGKYKDFEASVFLRGSKDPSKGFDFMLLHETGGTKKPHSDKGSNDIGKALALPMSTKYNFRTARGRIRKRWSPQALLEYYNTVGPATKNRKKRSESRKGKPKAFLMKSQTGLMIARRKSNKSRKVEILYKFIRSAKIDKRWCFVDTVRKVVEENLVKDVTNSIKRMK